MNRSGVFQAYWVMVVLVGVSMGFAVKPVRAACGNGVQELGEECDDGNLINGDGCENCLLTPPPNNECSAASPITFFGNQGSANGMITLATPSSPTACGVAQQGDVWFTATATCNGTLHIATYDSDIAPNPFMLLEAYHTCSGSLVGCASNGPYGYTQLRIPASIGEGFVIRLATRSGSFGEFYLSLECRPPLANDYCATASPVAEGNPAATGNNLHAVPQELESASCGGGGVQDVWFTYSASCTGVSRITAGETAFDHVLSVQDACGSTELTCDPGEGGGPVASVLFPVVSGQDYKVRLATSPTWEFNGNVMTHDYSLTIECFPVPANNECVDATAAVNGANSLTLGPATMDGVDEPSCLFPNGEASVYNDVWFDYVATCNGVLTANTCGALGFDTRLVVYEGCDCGSLGGPIDCNDNSSRDPFDAYAPCGLVTVTSALQTVVTQGQCYKIRLGTTASSSLLGAEVLNLACSAFPTCGDGAVNFPEECDDANVAEGDGCDAGCVLELPDSACAVTVDCGGVPRDNACNCSLCMGGSCQFFCTKFGNTTCDFAGLVDLDDVLCSLRGFSNFTMCTNADLFPCGGDTIINLDDLLVMLQAFSGANPCGCSTLAASPQCGSPTP